MLLAFDLSFQMPPNFSDSPRIFFGVTVYYYIYFCGFVKLKNRGKPDYELAPKDLSQYPCPEATPYPHPVQIIMPPKFPFPIAATLGHDIPP